MHNAATPCSGLVTERTGLEAKLGRDYGPDDVFLPLDGQCFSTAADKYTYEVCPFGAAAQKEGAGSTRCDKALIQTPLCTLVNPDYHPAGGRRIHEVHHQWTQSASFCM